MNSKLYDFLKFLAQIGLPALGTFYFVLAQIWNLPKAEEVVGTIVAADTLLGTLLGISTIQYNKNDKYAGALEYVRKPDGGRKYSILLNVEPEDLEDVQDLVLKVRPK